MRRRTKALWGAAGLVVALIGWGQWYAMDSTANPHVVVVEVRGGAQLEREGRVGMVEKDQVLQSSDRLMTPEDGEVELKLGEASFLRVGSGSRVELRSVHKGGVDLVLEDGRLEATIRPQDGVVRVESEGRVVSAEDATFAVGVMNGMLQVGTSQGEVRVEGEDVGRIVAGQEARFVDDYAEIGEVPESLLMDVSWPEAVPTTEPLKEVEGRTAPGARVKARGPWGERSVYAREDGYFVIEVPLEEGDNQLDLMAEDALGRQSAVIRVDLPSLDTRGPEYKAEVDYGD
jgi:hypothetical protein